MKLDALQAFVAFAETLNFTRAAERLHLSQPALHAKIARLADDFSTDLYFRQGRNLALTEQGARLEVFARSITEQVDEFTAELSAGPSDRPIVLTAGHGTHLYLLAEALGTWMTPVRRVQVRVEDGEAAVASVLAGRAHLGVTPVDTAHEKLERVRLLSVGQMAVVSKHHPFAVRKRLTLKDLSRQRLIVPPPDRPMRIVLSARLAEEGVETEIGVEVEGWELMLHFAQLGMGVAIVNDYLSVPEGAVGVSLTGLPVLDYHLIRRRGPRLSEASSLFDHLRATIGG